MNENEIMVQENEEVMPTVYEPEVTESEENSGMGTGAAVLLGSVLTLGAIAGAKLLKKAYHHVKAKRAMKACSEEPEVIDEEPCEPTSNDVQDEESEEEAK